MMARKSGKVTPARQAKNPDTPLDVLEALAAGDGPDRSLVALGYAGWGAGQLEDEILANSWLSVPAASEVVFDLPFEQRWTAAAQTLGIDITQIAPDAGHA